ncbi:MAG: FimV/HubP family polar landmark protein, partial [Burkholderiales bacterium]
VEPDLAIDTTAPSMPGNVDISFDVATSGTGRFVPDIQIKTDVRGGIDFDPGATGSAPLPALEIASGMINYNFEASKPAEAAAPAPVSSGAGAGYVDFSGISLRLDETTASSAQDESADAAAKDQRWYDVQTKYDLAKAYFEMGDKEGAREILQEVAQEGDAQQQEAAKSLLAQL